MRLERMTSADGVVFYASPILRCAGVPHAFSTRIGGVSGGPFASLNLGNPAGPVQDDLANIQENHRRLLTAAGLADRRLWRVRQVHGTEVVSVNGGHGACDAGEADGLITLDPQCAVSVRVADCVPVLLATADGGLVAAVHAGWRGVVGGIVGEAVRRLRDEAGRAKARTRGAQDRLGADSPSGGCRPSLQLLAAVGPSIGMGAFEVGPEVLAEFVRLFGGDAPIQRNGNGKGHVDLKEAIRRQLLAAGVAEDRIDVSDQCTFEHAEEFFSHRRERGVTGRMAAVIGVGPQDEG